MASLLVFSTAQIASPGEPAALDEPGSEARGVPGKWTKLSIGTVNGDVKPALRRTGDGMLHVVYSRKADAGRSSYGHSAVTASGAVQSRHTPISNWVNLGVPKLIPGPNRGMRLVFAAQRSTTTGDYYNDRVYSVRADSNGSNWTLESSFGSGYWAADAGALTLADGTPLAAFPQAGGHSPINWHVGLNDTPVSQGFSVNGFIHHVDAARQGNDVYLSWSTWNDNPDGTFVRRILPTYGRIHEVPGGGHLDGPSAVVARRGGGIFLLYCTGAVSCGSLKLWRMDPSGRSRARTVPQSAGARGPLSISAAPNGRLWIAWTEGDDKVRAVRTGTRALLFGPVRVLPHGPWGGARPNEVAIEGSRGWAEVITTAAGAAWHQRVLPGLTLRATPNRWPAHTRRTVSFSVRDAGVPVARVRIKALSRSCRTGSAGKCSITFPRLSARRFTATATKAGYHRGTVRLRIG